MEGPEQPPPRLPSVDIARGLAMALMAVDHVRVYSGVPAGGAGPDVFFTRWVTHFCAPAFVFLAGTSAFLQGARGGGTSRLRRTLIARGLWLVVLDLTVMRLGWTFNSDYRHFVPANVLWAIGWSMVVLAALVGLRVRVLAAAGLAIVAAHNLADGLAPRGAPAGALLRVLYVGGPMRPVGPDGPTFAVLYALVPWVGVMACGYAFGSLLARPRAGSRRGCLRIGLGAVALFVLLRALDVYGDPRPWRDAGAHAPGMHPVLRFLDTTKYPASLLFLLMTLGPTLAILPAMAEWRGAAARWLRDLGRVPLFFYVLHVPLIHGLACAVSVVRTGHVIPWLFANHPFGMPPAPPGYRWPLWMVYALSAVALALLTPLCRGFASARARGARWTVLA